MNTSFLPLEVPQDLPLRPLSNVSEKDTRLKAHHHHLPHTGQQKLPGEPVLSSFSPRPWSLWPLPRGVG